MESKQIFTGLFLSLMFQRGKTAQPSTEDTRFLTKDQGVTQNLVLA
jgi:hypothetical protein